jgi:hypothetical protein
MLCEKEAEGKLKYNMTREQFLQIERQTHKLAGIETFYDIENNTVSLTALDGCQLTSGLGIKYKKGDTIYFDICHAHHKFNFSQQRYYVFIDVNSKDVIVCDEPEAIGNAQRLTNSNYLLFFTKQNLEDMTKHTNVNFKSDNPCDK